MLQPRQRLPASLTLKIGTWNLAARKPGETAIAPQKPETPKKNWRHTFGAERTTAQWRKLDKGGFGADIIALQGVKSVRTVSRLFNARRYHIIASRQLLARSTVNSGGIAVLRADAPATTAVAFRRRRGVRIAGFRHFLPRHVKQGVEPPAITAFRLRIYRKMLWVASADTPSGCLVDTSPEACQHQVAIFNDFVTWAGQQISKQHAWLILLGQWPNSITASLNQAGFEVRDSIANDIACTPAPSSMRIFSPPADGAGQAKLDNAATAKSNPCAATADLTMKLR